MSVDDLVTHVSAGIQDVSGTPVDGDYSALQAMGKEARDTLERMLGRATVNSTWRIIFDASDIAGKRSLMLPIVPLVSITSVKAYDPDSVETTLVKGTDYLELAGERGILPLHEDADSWNDNPREYHALVVEITAGYGTAATDVLPEFVQAIKRLVAYYFRNRGEGFIRNSLTGGNTGAPDMARVFADVECLRNPHSYGVA